MIISISAVKGLLATAMGESESIGSMRCRLRANAGLLSKAALSQVEVYFFGAVRIRTDKQSVSGTILSRQNPRFVRIDDLSVDIMPVAVCSLILTGGVVGFVGTILGENQINIAEFQVGRRMSAAKRFPS